MEKFKDYLVTFLLPVNSTKYLLQTIESILEIPNLSSYAKILIVADRVGVKELKELVSDKLAKQNLRIINSEKSGIVSALNLGLSQIDTKYVARIDQDDIRIPKSLALQIELLESNIELLAVGGQIELIDSNTNSIGYSYYPTHQLEIKFTKYMTSPLAHPASVFRLESVLAIGGYRENLPEDWDLWLRLSEIGKITNLNSVVIRYRIHSSQLSRSHLYKSSNAEKLILDSLIERQKKIEDHAKFGYFGHLTYRVSRGIQNLKLRGIVVLKPVWVFYRKIRAQIMKNCMGKYDLQS